MNIIISGTSADHDNDNDMTFELNVVNNVWKN